MITSFKTQAYQFVTNGILKYLSFYHKKDKEKSIELLIKLFEKAEKFALKHKEEEVAGVIRFIIDKLKKRNPVILGYYYKILEKSPKVREKFFGNLLIRAFLTGRTKRKKFAKKQNLPAPFFFVISPTMRCNLNCKGCYAWQYKKTEELPFEIIDKIFSDAKKMGIYFITVSGGEPFLRKDLLDLFKKHNDIYFQVFTNGTLIDENLAQTLSELGNVAVVISIEGLKKETDLRRGSGVFERVSLAMENLKKAGVIFGYSTMPCQLNWQILLKDEFYEFLERKGALFGWFFQYIPVGKDPDPSLMLTPRQRVEINKKVHEIRKKMPMFAVDFWTDGPYVKGCLAAGRDGGGYFHINVYGDVEPCVFMHFAQDNVKDLYQKGKHLWDALRSPFFCWIRNHQPFNKEHRMPCMVIDNPHFLREAVKETHPYPTYKEAKNIICSPQIVSHLDRYSLELSKILKKEKY